MMISECCAKKLVKKKMLSFAYVLLLVDKGFSKACFQSIDKILSYFAQK